MRCWLVVALIAFVVVCDARRVKREHKHHTKTHHNQHEKSVKHHLETDKKAHHVGHGGNTLHLKRVSGCNCPEGQVCVEGSATRKPLCVNRHFLKQGERLFRDFQRHHPDIKYEGQQAKHHQVQPHIEKPHDVHISVHAEHEADHPSNKQHDAQHSVSRHQEMQLPRNKYPSNKHHEIKHVSNKHHNEVHDKSHHILEHHQRTGSMNHHAHHKKVAVCTQDDFSDMRQRLTGWFRLLHAEDKEHRRNHHGNHHKKHHHLSVKKELRDHHDGKCKAQPSVMWKFHTLDVDTDHHLTIAELAEMENNGREPCLRPFLESCDTDRDARLSGHEWRCCFADAIPPCYAKQRNNHLETEAYIPRCDREGYFEKEQCHGRTMETRTCWCVDLNGNEIPKTRARVRAHCEKVDVLGHMKKH
ncbi:histidine-rich glycoprotein-like [Haliotis rubra]|uniref:histidine-rich glycoprotein-like n=1 Tax=Haliotis rubra TaxID=36100 RepID=UPI001EE5C077|nr:histidine-rich glycoprotein-like [Haliotis rubra]